MKIELTHNEARNLCVERLRAIHGDAEGIELTIADQPRLDGTLATIDLMALVEVARDTRPDQKIPAIRRIREITSNRGIHVGLGDAKRFIEALMPVF